MPTTVRRGCHRVNLVSSKCDNQRAGGWSFLVVLWSLGVVVLAVAVAPITQRSIVKWSLRFNVLIADSASERWLAARLRRARIIRWTTFALGIDIGMLPVYMNLSLVQPRRDKSEATRRLDDALRADGAHHVVGASIALGGIAALASISDAVGATPWNLLTGLLTYVVLDNWYGIACTTRWNVDQVRLQHA